MKQAKPPVYINMTYAELGDYVKSDSVVQVTKQWFDSLDGIERTKKGCTKCHEFLSLDKFNVDKRRQSGKRSQCKSCYKEGRKSQLRTLKNEEPKIEYKLINLNE